MTEPTRGWAAYKVADHVRSHHVVGIGLYADLTADPTIVLDFFGPSPTQHMVRSGQIQFFMYKIQVGSGWVGF